MKKFNCVLLAIVCFVLGGVTVHFTERYLAEKETYVFEDYHDMSLSAVDWIDATPNVPLDAQWIAGVHFDEEAQEVIVFVKEGCNVPLTEEFVLNRVKDTGGYTLAAVRESRLRSGEVLGGFHALKMIFAAYDSDMTDGKNPWLVCQSVTDPERGFVVEAAIREDGVAHTAEDEQFARRALETVFGEKSVIWVDDLEPKSNGAIIGYAQLPYDPAPELA